jgi:adenylate kinase family enzyme
VTEDQQVERVAVVGSGGAGKSTLSVELGRRTGLPVIHLDQHFWSAGWVPMDDEPWEARVRELVAGERWIIDGNYRGTMLLRFDRADTVVFLDLPRVICVLSVIWRSIRHIRTPRPDMSDGNPEKLDPAFLRWIWNFRRRNRPGMIQALDALPPSTNVIRLTSRRAIRTWLDGIAAQTRAAA